MKNLRLAGPGHKDLLPGERKAEIHPHDGLFTAFDLFCPLEVQTEQKEAFTFQNIFLLP